MPIIELQRRLHEAGRIRIGHQVEGRTGKKRPASLATFRLTSPDRQRIEAAAKLYGGKVTAWDAPSGQQYEVITTSDRLPVVVPPSAMAFSVWFELWSGGGCQRRCDGVSESISEQPCMCVPEDRECDPHARLSVMLRDLAGLGLWRLDSTGYYAAVELQGAVDVISLAAGRGHLLPATLRVEQRVAKRPDEGTRHFVVPVLDIEVSPAQLLMGTVGVGTGVGSPMIEPAEPARSLTPVPDGGPAPSIADQVAASENQPSRRRASTQVIPASGLAPRTAAQASQVQGGRPSSRVTDTFAPQPAASPRMCTGPQLQKLGILLGKQGFDGSAEGKAARLSFCASALKQLFPDDPEAGRAISSSKELTFDEGRALINMLEEDERKERARKEQSLREDPYPSDGDVPAVDPAEVFGRGRVEEDLAVEKSMEDAAEQIRRSRAKAAEQVDDVDPLADSPHGPGCDPACQLTEEEHPPVEEAVESTLASLPATEEAQGAGGIVTEGTEEGASRSSDGEQTGHESDGTQLGLG